MQDTLWGTEKSGGVMLSARGVKPAQADLPQARRSTIQPYEDSRAWGAEPKRRASRGESGPAPVTEVPSSVPDAVRDEVRLPGRPLDPDLRSSMESSFGHDLAHVRIHANRSASESALAVDAAAYTVGAHIVLAEEDLEVDRGDGRQLLAHELAHVVQQRDGVVTAGGADSHSERVAESAASAVVRGAKVGPMGTAGVSLALSPQPRKASQLNNEEATRVLLGLPTFSRSTDASGGAMEVISEVLLSRQTAGNAAQHQLRLRAAFSLLAPEDATVAHAALTRPKTPAQRKLRDAFNSLDKTLRAKLLDILRSREAGAMTPDDDERAAVDQVNRSEIPSTKESLISTIRRLPVSQSDQRVTNYVALALRSLAWNDPATYEPVLAALADTRPLVFKAVAGWLEHMRRESRVTASHRLAQEEAAEFKRDMELSKRSPGLIHMLVPGSEYTYRDLSEQIHNPYLRFTAKVNTAEAFKEAHRRLLALGDQAAMMEILVLGSFVAPVAVSLGAGTARLATTAISDAWLSLGVAATSFGTTASGAVSAALTFAAGALRAGGSNAFQFYLNRPVLVNEVASLTIETVLSVEGDVPGLLKTLTEDPVQGAAFFLQIWVLHMNVRTSSGDSYDVEIQARLLPIDEQRDSALRLRPVTAPKVTPATEISPPPATKPSSASPKVARRIDGFVRASETVPTAESSLSSGSKRGIGFQRPSTRAATVTAPSVPPRVSRRSTPSQIPTREPMSSSSNGPTQIGGDPRAISAQRQGEPVRAMAINGPGKGETGTEPSQMGHIKPVPLSEISLLEDEMSRRVGGFARASKPKGRANTNEPPQPAQAAKKEAVNVRGDVPEGHVVDSSSIVESPAGEKQASRSKGASSASLVKPVQTDDGAVELIPIPAGLHPTSDPESRTPAILRAAAPQTVGTAGLGPATGASPAKAAAGENVPSVSKARESAAAGDRIADRAAEAKAKAESAVAKARSAVAEAKAQLAAVPPVAEPVPSVSSKQKLPESESARREAQRLVESAEKALEGAKEKAHIAGDNQANAQKEAVTRRNSLSEAEARASQKALAKASSGQDKPRWTHGPYSPKEQRRPDLRDMTEPPSAIDYHSGLRTNPDARVSIYPEPLPQRVAAPKGSTPQEIGHDLERALRDDVLAGSKYRVTHQAGDKTRHGDIGAYEAKAKTELTSEDLDQVWRDLNNPVRRNTAHITMPRIGQNSVDALARMAAMFERLTGKRPTIVVREYARSDSEVTP